MLRDRSTRGLPPVPDQGNPERDRVPNDDGILIHPAQASAEARQYPQGTGKIPAQPLRSVPGSRGRTGIQGDQEEKAVLPRGEEKTAKTLEQALVHGKKTLQRGILNKGCGKGRELFENSSTLFRKGLPVPSRPVPSGIKTRGR